MSRASQSQGETSGAKMGVSKKCHKRKGEKCTAGWRVGRDPGKRGRGVDGDTPPEAATADILHFCSPGRCTTLA